MIAETEDLADAHLEILSAITRHMKDAHDVDAILRARNADELIHLFDGKAETSATDLDMIDDDDDIPKVLAVTGCPVGIAHTYIAASALEDKAKELNISFKVETNGAVGVKNKLTNEDIDNAQAIIIASDTQVDMERFIGKKVIDSSSHEGIKNPEKLLNRALKGEGVVYTSTKEKSKIELQAKERTGIYRHLMNGISNMLPFVVGGGILMALSLLFGINAVDPNEPDFNLLAKILMDLGGDSGAFGLMVPVLAGFSGF